VAFFFALRLEDLENQVLFAKAAGAWISRVRAMRVSSVMFFSFSSAMVMFTCESEDVSGVSGMGKCSGTLQAGFQGWRPDCAALEDYPEIKWNTEHRSARLLERQTARTVPDSTIPFGIRDQARGGFNRLVSGRHEGVAKPGLEFGNGQELHW